MTSTLSVKVSEEGQAYPPTSVDGGRSNCQPDPWAWSRWSKVPWTRNPRGSPLCLPERQGERDCHPPVWQRWELEGAHPRGNGGSCPGSSSGQLWWRRWVAVLHFFCTAKVGQQKLPSAEKSKLISTFSAMEQSRSARTSNTSYFYKSLNHCMFYSQKQPSWRTWTPTGSPESWRRTSRSTLPSSRGSGRRCTPSGPREGWSTQRWCHKCRQSSLKAPSPRRSKLASR